MIALHFLISESVRFNGIVELLSYVRKLSKLKQVYPPNPME